MFCLLNFVFTYADDLSNPNGTMVLAPDGYMYGIALNGGLYKNGGIYRINSSNHNYSLVYSFPAAGANAPLTTRCPLGFAYESGNCTSEIMWDTPWVENGSLMNTGHNSCPNAGIGWVWNKSIYGCIVVTSTDYANYNIAGIFNWYGKLYLSLRSGNTCPSGFSYDGANCASNFPWDSALVQTDESGSQYVLNNGNPVCPSVGTGWNGNACVIVSPQDVQKFGAAPWNAYGKLYLSVNGTSCPNGFSYDGANCASSFWFENAQINNGAIVNAGDQVCDFKVDNVGWLGDGCQILKPSAYNQTLYGPPIPKLVADVTFSINQGPALGAPTYKLVPHVENGILYLYGIARDNNNNTAVFKIENNGTNFEIIQRFTSSSNYALNNLLSININPVDNKIYMTSGGSDGYFYITKMDSDGNNITFLNKSGDNVAPKYFPTDLLFSLDGNTFYGVSDTAAGGLLYSEHTDGSSFTVLHTFARQGSGDDGIEPLSIVMTEDGTIIGTTGFGGSGNNGTIFKYNLTNNNYFSYSINSDFAQPWFGLSLDGTYLYGKSVGLGNTSEKLWEWNYNDNSAPMIFLTHTSLPTPPATPPERYATATDTLLINNGVVYVSNYSSGKYSFGNIFTVNRDGSFNTIYDFAGSTPGAIANYIADNIDQLFNIGIDSDYYLRCEPSGKNLIVNVLKTQLTGTLNCDYSDSELLNGDGSLDGDYKIDHSVDMYSEPSFKYEYASLWNLAFADFLGNIHALQVYNVPFNSTVYSWYVAIPYIVASATISSDPIPAPPVVPVGPFGKYHKK